MRSTFLSFCTVHLILCRAVLSMNLNNSERINFRKKKISEKNLWECWEPTPGQLGEKLKRYLCAMPPPPHPNNSFFLICNRTEKYPDTSSQHNASTYLTVESTNLTWPPSLTAAVQSWSDAVVDKSSSNDTWLSRRRPDCGTVSDGLGLDRVGDSWLISELFRGWLGC